MSSVAHISQNRNLIDNLKWCHIFFLKSLWIEKLDMTNILTTPTSSGGNHMHKKMFYSILYALGASSVCELLNMEEFLALHLQENLLVCMVLVKSSNYVVIMFHT